MKSPCWLLALILGSSGVTGLISCGGSAASAGQSATPSQAGNCNTSFPYCMTVDSGNVIATVSQSGSGFEYSGTVTFTFSPALPADSGSIDVVFNASNMVGTAMANGNSQLTFTISGTTVACQFAINPSTVDAFRSGSQIALAQDMVSWMGNGIGTGCF
jgi:autotransporter translocation and assembly factor TamB